MVEGSLGSRIMFWQNKDAIHPPHHQIGDRQGETFTDGLLDVPGEEVLSVNKDGSPSRAVVNEATDGKYKSVVGHEVDVSIDISATGAWDGPEYFLFVI
jgi:hypothetical protein